MLFRSFNTDDAPHFDYMKNSFLISNKIFFVSELPQDYNFSFEDNLFGIKNNLIVSDYDNIINSVNIYLSLYNETLIKTIVDKAHNWFLENSGKAEDSIIECFSGVQTWGKPSYSRL